MKKSIFFIIAILMFSLTTYSAVAVLLTDNLISYYNFSEQSGSTTYDGLKRFNGTIGSAIVLNQTGIIDKAYMFNGANGAISFGNMPVSNSLLSYNFWMKRNLTSSGEFVISKFTGSTYEESIYLQGSPDAFALFPTGDAFATGVWLNNSWTMVTIVKNGTNYELFVNGVAQSNRTHSAGAVQTTFYIGNRNPSAAFGYKGYMDEIGIWNRTLNTTEISQLYNSGNGFTYPFTFTPTVSSPSFVAPTPNNNTKNNTQMTINATCDAGNTTLIWFDSNPVPTTLVVNSSLLGNYTTNVNGSTVVYYYRAGCFSGGYYSQNTTIRKWTYDATFPVITINPNNEFNVNNYTIRNAYDKSVFLNFSFLDDSQLFAYQINITKGGVVYFDETNSTLTSLSYNYSKTINAASWAAGVYDIQLFVSDSHTAKEIPVYDLEKKKSSLKFKTELNNVIEISSDEPSTVDSQKKLDRYDFDFAFDDKKSKDRLFHVKSEKYPIVWIQNSKYKAHFVIYGDKGGNWVDFEGIQGKPIVNKINDKHFTVYFSNVPDKVKFNSIGGLNVYEANFTFYVGNYSFNNPVGTINDYSNFLLNLTKDNVHVNNISANFYYNGTLNTNQTAINGSNFNYFENSILSPAVTSFMPFVWNITVFNLDGSSVNFNVSGNQTVSSFGIVNCGTYTNTTLILTYFNESNPANAINASLEVDLSVYATNPLNRWNYSVTLPVNYTHRLCIFPENVSLTGDVYFKYENPTGFIQRYFFINHTFTESVQNLELYNWDTTDLNSLLKLTTRKVSDYGYYKNVVATLQRFYVGEGVWRNVQMDESGDFGGLNFNILEKNTDYRLIFVDRATNSVLKTTQPIKFVCSSGLCDLTYLLNPDSAISSNNSFVYSWTYNNATKILLFNWSDGSGISQDVRMYAWKSTITGVLSVCDSNQTGNAGFYSCNATNYTGTVFVSISNGGDVVVGEYLDLAKTKLGDLLPAGEGAWWALVIMVTVIMFGVFSPIGSIITGILGLIIIFMLGIFSVLTMTGLIIAIVVGVVIGIKVKQ